MLVNKTTKVELTGLSKEHITKALTNSPVPGHAEVSYFYTGNTDIDIQPYIVFSWSDNE